MKKLTSFFVASCLLWVVTLQTACIGSFKMTHAYWDWNLGLGKWPGAVLFFFLGGIITGVTLLVDVVILNLIEFWTGDNPMSMKEGEFDRQVMVGTDGNSYEVTASKNRFDIVTLDGSNAGQVNALIYSPENKTWSHEKNCVITPLIQYSESGAKVKLFGQDGKMAVLPSGMTDRVLAAQMIKSQFDSQICVN